MLLSPIAIAAPTVTADAEFVDSFPSDDARQGIAVDGQFFYTANNYGISKHDKTTGRLLDRWQGDAEGDPLQHLDSLVVVDGKLYASHSNYPHFPMTSSVEVWDAETLEHVDSHSFGVFRGSFTWLDRHDGFWWGAFANYDRVQRGQSQPYGLTSHTQVVKMNDAFTVVEAWTIPGEILDRFRPMSNSGGSWGADGYLYLTGHDLGEFYVMQVPEFGSTLDWIATVNVPEMEGQGIAWDRSGPTREIWAIVKARRTALRLRVPSIDGDH